MIRVGALQAAKPYGTVQGRQQFGAESVRRPAELALPRRLSLILPSGHANRPPRIESGSRPDTCRFPTRFTCSLHLFDSGYYIEGVSF